MPSTKQLAYWENKFGDEYIKRNSDISLFIKRKKFFKRLIKPRNDIQTILEVGCNVGGNLFVIKKSFPELELTGIEPNKKAAKLAKKLVPKSTILNSSVQNIKLTNQFDLVFTSGVLIHIADKDISKALRKIYTLSKKYILTVEYFAEKRMTVPYRKLSDALFKRPYDYEWTSLYPSLKLIANGFLTLSEGFDDCHWWLYEK